MGSRESGKVEDNGNGCPRGRDSNGYCSGEERGVPGNGRASRNVPIADAGETERRRLQGAGRGSVTQGGAWAIFQQPSRLMWQSVSLSSVSLKLEQLVERSSEAGDRKLISRRGGRRPRRSFPKTTTTSPGNSRHFLFSPCLGGWSGRQKPEGSTAEQLLQIRHKKNPRREQAAFF